MASFLALQNPRQISLPKNVMPKIKLQNGAHQALEYCFQFIIIFCDCENNYHLALSSFLT